MFLTNKLSVLGIYTYIFVGDKLYIMNLID
jgi:hypothetical protein